MHNQKSQIKPVIAFIVFLCLLGMASCNVADPPIPNPGIIAMPTDENPAWSPDGKYVAFNHFNPEADENTNPYSLNILNLETGERTLVIEGPAFNPDWSPDGEWIAFNSGDIFQIRSDGSGLKRLTGQSMSFFPRWSPDGNTISYGRSGSQDVVGLWFFHLPDSTYQRFGFGGSPADWSPDGEMIVFGAHNQFEDPVSASTQIWISDIEDNSREQLTNNEYKANRSASWSSDGQWITWHNNKGIWIMRSDGSEQQHLSDGQYPTWSPDSQRIIFSKPNSDESKNVLWTINRDGSGLQQITF